MNQMESDIKKVVGQWAERLAKGYSSEDLASAQGKIEKHHKPCATIPLTKWEFNAIRLSQVDSNPKEND